jgi:hypothetical protein
MITQTDLNTLEELRTNVISEAQATNFAAIPSTQLQILFADFFSKLLHDLDRGSVSAPSAPPSQPPVTPPSTTNDYPTA